MKKFSFIATFVICVVMAAATFSFMTPEKIEASSHREAPYMTLAPKVDITDFYMFQSYDDANQGTNDRTTLIMNFHPLQDAFGGPNYFFPDENALYQINIDNNGNGLPNIILRIQFNFKNNNFRKLTVNTNDDGGDTQTEIPLIALPLGLDGIEEEADAQLNVVESYTLTIIKNGGAQQAINDDNSTGNSKFVGTTTFVKPVDNIGNTTITDYDAYAAQHIYDFNALGIQGRVFVGQRNDPFIVNLGQIFDGLTINAGQEIDAIAAKNITSFCIELPTSFLALNDDPVTNNVFGGWATTLQRGQTNVFQTVGQGNLQNNGLPGGGTIFKQVSRLGMPLVNEAVIGVSVKDRFNNSIPAFDAQFAGFVTDSTLAAIMNIVTLNGIIDAAPTNERGDLVQIFAQGVDFNGIGVGNVNNVFGPGVAEYQRLDVSITPTDLLAQNAIGLAAGDDAGFPNGRRPIDDTVDIALKVVAGLLANALTGGAIVGDADAGNATDGVGEVAANNIVSEGLIEDFPFLGTPISGDDAGGAKK